MSDGEGGTEVLSPLARASDDEGIFDLLDCVGIISWSL